MGNFKVGDKVEVVSSNFGSINEPGDVGVIVSESGGSLAVKVKGRLNSANWHSPSELKSVESKPSKKQRIETLEKEVSELKLIVHELRERKETPVTLEIDGKKLSTTSVIGKTIEPSTDISVEDKQADVIEFEGQQYRKVERKAVEGDVVIFTSIPEDESGVDVEEGKPYRAYEGKGLYKKYIKDDTGFTLHIYGGGILRGTTETVDVYEPINQPVQRQTVPCSAVRPPIEEVGEAFFEGANKVLNPKTANQLRAEVIEKAKGFVEGVTSRNHPDVRTQDLTHGAWFVNELGVQRTIEAKFVIDDKKRTVVALMQSVITDTVRSKGIAKCNPSDVFNSHIGKAIALGRALGLDVSEFEQAVQPSELTVGMVVTSSSVFGSGVVKEIKPEGYIRHEEGYTTTKGEWTYISNATIINDTNAIYGGVE